MQKFQRVYLEITNVCNRACAFCPGTKREKRFLSTDEFRTLAEKIRPHTDYLYLHVMGEPLLHPELKQILSIAKSLGLRVIITTNGTLLAQVSDTILQSECVHKVHISLHAFEANDGGDLSDYVNSCANFGKAASSLGILVNFRLWNLDGATTVGLNTQNDAILRILHAVFTEYWEQNTWGYRLCDGVFVQYGERFDWPDQDAKILRSHGLCYALRRQIAVLCDGTVVPCCLDHDGSLPLGNLFEQSLEQILQGNLAQSVLRGVSGRGELAELCKRCGYAGKFSK
ncbi:MAG: radical SAM protein [Oscillospiraceae bacterium]|nr:radical SAM protein [Oscillospiraceae bacterium]